MHGKCKRLQGQLEAQDLSNAQQTSIEQQLTAAKWERSHAATNTRKIQRNISTLVSKRNSQQKPQYRARRQQTEENQEDDVQDAADPETQIEPHTTEADEQQQADDDTGEQESEDKPRSRSRRSDSSS